MAGLLTSKRPRDEPQIEEINEGGDQELKRQKSYHQIMSLLDEEEEEAIEDLSSIITTLQQEITSSFSSESHNPNYQNNITTITQDYTDFSSSSFVTDSNSTTTTKELELELEEEGEERERVMRHLLEASDDELGIVPNYGVVGEQEVALSLSDAFWELEDEAANYYTLFQSQLFM